MRRFVSLFSILALTAFIGCEQLENPNAPVDQDAIRKPQPNQQTDRLDKPNTTDLKFNSDETKAKLEAVIAQAQGMVNQYKAQHPPKQANPMALSKPRILNVPGVYATIQDAVDDAKPGDEIEVEGGTYNETVIVITPNIEIKGDMDEEDEEITVNGAFVVGGADGVEIEHFNIIPTNPIVGIIVLGSSNVEITGNTISGAGAFLGILLFAGNNCIVKENKVSDTFLGIVLVTSNGNTLDANTAKGNVAGMLLIGIIFGPSVDDNNIKNNICDDNLAAGIALIGAADNKLSGNSCNRNISGSGAGIGIFLALASQNTIGPNNIANGNDALGLWLASGADNNTVKKNTFRRNTILDILNEGLGNKFKSNKAKNTSGV